MNTPLLTTFDRALQQRAKANAAEAVRAGQQHAAERREAEAAVAPGLLALERRLR